MGSSFCALIRRVVPDVVCGCHLAPWGERGYAVAAVFSTCVRDQLCFAHHKRVHVQSSNGITLLAFALLISQMHGHSCDQLVRHVQLTRMKFDLR